MAIVLYPHNENAYHAALAMRRETGQAAVIHSTEAGNRSFDSWLNRLWSGGWSRSN